MTAVTSEHVIPAVDGYPLAATLYRCPERQESKVAIVTAAMGVRRGRYQELSLHMARQGWTVLTFDYRGIGGSRGRGAVACDARLADWGAKDLAGAIDWTQRELGPRRFVVVGHSVGGQIIGLAPNHDKLDAVLMIGAQKGYWKYWDRHWKYIVGGFWLALPVLVRVFGYLPMWPAGCDGLPPQVALDWQRWAMYPDFLDECRRSLGDQFRQFRSPILAISFTDDPLYAPPRAVRALLDIYANAPSQHRLYGPGELGVSRIGHSGFFVPGVCPKLWESTLEWLESVGTDSELGSAGDFHDCG
jgi:predicted alpha/beta hydrolase